MWARQVEVKFDRGGLPVDNRAPQTHTLADLLKRYAAEVVPRKRIADREACKASRCRWLPAIIQLAVETEMRRSELLAIRWEDVNLEAHTVFLRNTKNAFRAPSLYRHKPST